MKNVSKFLISIVILIGTLNINAQNKVKIEFNKLSCGDYDLMLKEILNQNGFHAVVDYGNNSMSANYDYIIEYKTISRETYDELHKWELSLYDGNRKIIKSVAKTISYINFGINEANEMKKALSKLLNRKMRFINDFESKQVKYLNISFNVHKLDSAIYAIVAKGAGIRPLRDVEKAFLKKAGQYLNEFDYYFEDGDYGYKSYGLGFTHSHGGKVVFGIIRPLSSNETSPNKLDCRPIEFVLEFP